jgi:hypothetical protein
MTCVQGDRPLLSSFAIRVLMFAAAPAVAMSQPRAIEIWGSAGAAQAAGDEGSLGSGFAYGGGIAVPFTRRLAVEVDITRFRVERFEPVTRTLISPALVYRWGTDKVYGFAGGGLGLQRDRGSFARFEMVPNQEQPLMTPLRFSDTGATLHGRGGLVIHPGAHIIVRTEFFAAWRYVMPSVGVKIGIGYRF